MLVRNDAIVDGIEWAEVRSYQNRVADEKTWSLSNPRFNASTFIDCSRQWAYKWLGYEGSEEDIVLQYKRSALLGDAIHGIVQSWLKGSGLAILVPSFEIDDFVRAKQRAANKLMRAIEVPLKPYNIPFESRELIERYKITGRVDAIVQNRDGESVVLEIKTVTEKYFFDSYKRFFANKLEHFDAQLQIYMELLKIPKGICLVINQEQFLYMLLNNEMFDFKTCMQGYDTVLDKEFIEAQFNRMEQLHNQVIKNKELPAPEWEKGNCKFCKFLELCPATKTQKSGKAKVKNENN